MMAACTEEGTSATGSQTIGPSGGSITVEGATLRVPAGALSTSRSISIRRVDSTPPSSLIADSDVFEFGPDGLVFASPVTVTFDVPNVAASTRVYWSTAVGDYEGLATEIGDDEVSASITHFSRGFAGRARDDRDAGATEDAGSTGDASMIVDAAQDADGASDIDAGSDAGDGAEGALDAGEADAADGSGLGDSGPDAGAEADGAADAEATRDAATDETSCADELDDDGDDLVDCADPDCAMTPSCPCAFGHEECEGSCVDTRTEVMHCGECSFTCSAGQVCVDGICVMLPVD
jgi:hypothetical protein